MTSSSYNKVFVAASVSVSVVAALLLLHRGSLRSRKAAVLDNFHSDDPITEDLCSPELRVIDLSSYTAIDSCCKKTSAEECKAVANALRDYGIVIVRDQRASVADNDAFIDMMERYADMQSIPLFLPFC